MTRMPASSPCAPASGASDASSMPVISASMRCRPCMTASAPCASSAGCSGCASREAGHGGDGVVDLRVELHRAGAERVHVRVDRPVELREAREVAHDVELRQLGQPQLVAQQFRRDGVGAGGHVGRRQRRRRCGRGARVRSSVRFERRSLRGIALLRSSASASTSASISARVFISVTQSSMRLCDVVADVEPPMMPRSSSARVDLGRRSRRADDELVEERLVALDAVAGERVDAVGGVVRLVVAQLGDAAQAVRAERLQSTSSPRAR